MFRANVLPLATRSAVIHDVVPAVILGNGQGNLPGLKDRFVSKRSEKAVAERLPATFQSI